MENKKALLLVITLILLLTSSCVSTKDVILDPTCQAPCWRGISYGMEKDEVLKLVSEMDDMQVEITEDLSEVLISLKARPKFRVYINFEEERVVSFDFLNYKKGIVTLEEAINWYGKPASVVGLFYPGIFQASSVWLCYFEEGLSLELKGQRGSNNEYALAPDTEVISIYYIDLQSELAERTGETCLNITRNHVVTDWQGYGSYQTCNPEILDWCGR